MAKKAGPTIALITDFGTEDGYVGAVKGRILSIAPRARIVDISHNIAPFNIRQAAYCLNNSYPYFPDKTIFVTVVDPGVGTERRGIIVKTSKHHFVGPDNGVFSYIFYREGYQAFEILTDRVGSDVSATFHGRDVFARIAAEFISDKELVYQRTRSADNVCTLLKKPIKLGERKLELEIIHVDHFGNLILNFHQNDLLPFSPAPHIRLNIGNISLNRIYPTFGSVSPGKILAVWDSSGFLQIAKNSGNAAGDVKLHVGDKVNLSL